MALTKRASISRLCRPCVASVSIALAVGLFWGWSAAASSDLTLSFTVIEPNNSTPLNDQFIVEVSDLANGQARFDFFNLDPPGEPSGIAEVYWEETDPALLDFSSDSNTIEPGWNWTFGAKPSNVPGHTNVDFQQAGSADGDNSGPHTVSPGESIYFDIALTSGTTFDILSDALLAGDMRLAMHVRELGPDGSSSDSYITSAGVYSAPASVVAPLPHSAGLGVFGFVLLGIVQCMRRSGVMLFARRGVATAL